MKAPSLEGCLIVNDVNVSTEILSRALTTGTANTVLKGDKSAKQSHIFPMKEVENHSYGGHACK